MKKSDLKKIIREAITELNNQKELPGDFAFPLNEEYKCICNNGQTWGGNMNGCNHINNCKECCSAQPYKGVHPDSGKATRNNIKGSDGDMYMNVATSY